MNEFHLRAKRVLLEILLLDILLLLLWFVWSGGRYVVSGMLLGGIVSLYQVFSIAMQTEKIASFALGMMRRKPVFGMVSRWAAVLLAGVIAAKHPGISIIGTVIGVCFGWLLLLIDAIAFPKVDSE
jgi:D-alanyl-lipoteichoic acid acyltransferase DltB (MBOAT superfamily)